MPLQKQTAGFPLAKGIDTKSDQFQLPVGQLAAVKNGVYTSPNQIQKRFGYTPISNTDNSGNTVTGQKRLSTFLDEKIEITNNALYSLSESTNQLTNKGLAVSAIVSNTSVDSQSSNNNSDVNQDGAFHPNGLFLSCWEIFESTSEIGTAAGAYYSITDYATGELIVARTSLGADAINPKCIVLGSYFFVFYVDTGTNKLRVVTIQATAPASPNTTADVATNMNASNPFYDVSLGGARIFIAYNTNSGGGAISVRYTDTSLTISGATTIAGESASRCINVVMDSSNNQVWVSYSNGTAIKTFARDYDLTASVLSPTTIETLANVRNVTVYAVSGLATFFYERYETQSNIVQGWYTYILKNTCTNVGVVGSSSTFLMNLGLTSKVFSFNGTYYMTVAFQSIVQATYFVIDISGKVLTKILPSQSGGLTNQVYLANFVASTLCEVSIIDSTNFVLALLQQRGAQYLRSLGTIDSNTFAQNTVFGVIYSTVSLEESTYQNVSSGNGLLLVGGYCSYYDGVSVTENGFHFYPETVKVAQGISGHLADGTYSYKATYEWTDNFGQIHRSAASPLAVSVAITSGSGTASVQAYIPVLPLSSKSSVQVVLYRTAASGTAYYRVPKFYENDTSAPFITFVDDLPQDLTGYEELYTDTGEVDNSPLPSTNLMFQYGTRVIAIPTENKNSWWYSKEVVPGGPVEFSEDFVAAGSSRGGGITGGIELDSKIIFWKNARISYVTGQGPALNGASNDFSQPQDIPTDVGLPPEEANSICLSPIGVFFKSQKGIYLLDRSLNVSYIGAPVESYNNQICTSAVLVENKTEIRFTMDGGVVLVYNYFVQQWSIFENIDAVSSIIWDGVYTYLSTSGAFEESSTLYTDNGNLVPMTIETGWLNFAGIQGFQRIFRIELIGRWKSAHSLIVKLARDYDPNWFQTSVIEASNAVMEGSTFGSDTPFGEGSPFGGVYQGLYQWDVSPQIQRCESMKIKFTDSQNTTYGEGYSMSNISFEIGVDTGLNRLPASRRVG